MMVNCNGTFKNGIVKEKQLNMLAPQISILHNPQITESQTPKFPTNRIHPITKPEKGKNP